MSLLILIVFSLPSSEAPSSLAVASLPKKPYSLDTSSYPKIIKITYPQPPKEFNTKLKLFIISECNRNDVPYLLVFKLIEKESSWDRKARNYNKDEEGNVVSIDYGLMQINSTNLELFSKLYRSKDREASSYDIKYNAYDNVEMGIKHLKDLYTTHGSWKEAVMAYNGGSPRVFHKKVKASTKEYAEYICPIENWWTFPTNVVLDKNGRIL